MPIATLVVGALAIRSFVNLQAVELGFNPEQVVTLHIVTAASAAVVATSLWLLVSRDEIEPWYGTTGVVASAAAALTVLIVGFGFSAILHDEGLLTATTFAVTIPWAVAAGATGWLRPSPAIAMVTPAVGQAIWLLIH